MRVCGGVSKTGSIINHTGFALQIHLQCTISNAWFFSRVGMRACHDALLLLLLLSSINFLPLKPNRQNSEGKPDLTHFAFLLNDHFLSLEYPVG